MQTLLNYILILTLLVPAAFAASPNVVILFADDLGYGDVGAFGNPTIHTPNLDRMAHEGQRWTSFYVAAPVCTPSRAGIMTGRLPVRMGMVGPPGDRVLFPDSVNGLPPSEVTIAEVVKAKGYATMAIGKWHLGHRPQFLPTAQGFDSYFGIPYSNDMDKIKDAPKGWKLWEYPEVKNFDVPLMRDEKIVERPADQNTLNRRYTEEAAKFINAHKGGPFFLYLAYSSPHVPLFRSKAFAGVSLRGRFGDVVEEIDWSVGKVLAALKQAGVDGNTLVVFTSDNGPWLLFREQGGTAGLLREGKGSTWEGGMREPAIFRWPGKVKRGTVLEMGSTLDLLPTIAALTGGKVPTDRPIDGYDITPVLFGTGASPRNEMFYYRGDRLWAARVGNYKAHYFTKSGYRNDPELTHNPPLLFQLGHDPSEQWDVAEKHPEIVAEINQAVAAHKRTVKHVKSLFIDRDPSVVTATK